MGNRNEVINGVKLMSVEASEATDQIIELLPENMDMEQLIGIVGNICLRFGVTGKELRTFESGLREFVEIMREILKEAENG